MNNHLTPVPRTDKNGRVTTRHMKTIDTSASGVSIPIVQLPVSNAHKDTVEQDAGLLSAIYGDEDNPTLPRNHEKAIRFVNQQHPELLNTVNMLLAKNNDGGSASARNYLMASLNLLGDNISLTEDPDVLRLSYTDGLNAEFDETIVRAWAIGSMRAEFPNTYTSFYDDDFQDGLAGLRLLIYGSNTASHPNRKTDTDYWRGMTALYLTGSDDFFDTTEGQQEAHRFVEWAGTQADLTLAVSIVAERKTINVDHITSVIAQGHHAPAIRNGAL